MTGDLVERIGTAPRSRYDGAAYRQQSPAYDPLGGEGARIHGGRFNPPNSFAVLYLCATPGCAAAEFMRFAHNQPIGPAGFLPRTLFRYETRLSTVLDLTDEPTVAHLGLDSRSLVEDDRVLTHQIGEIAHQFGYQAVLNASATGVDEVLALFLENLRGGTIDPRVEQTWHTLDDLPVF
jgi:RES domain-containing protein